MFYKQLCLKTKVLSLSFYVCQDKSYSGDAVPQNINSNTNYYNLYDYGGKTCHKL